MLHSLGVNPRPSDEMLSVGLLQLFNSEEGSLLTSQVSDLMAGRSPETVIGEAADLVLKAMQPEFFIVHFLPGTLRTRTAHKACASCRKGVCRPVQPIRLATYEHLRRVMRLSLDE
jgi:hypothetical protein